jgi:hypothetical protein
LKVRQATRPRAQFKNNLPHITVLATFLVFGPLKGQGLQETVVFDVFKNFAIFWNITPCGSYLIEISDERTVGAFHGNIPHVGNTDDQVTLKC